MAKLNVSLGWPTSPENIPQAISLLISVRLTQVAALQELADLQLDHSAIVDKQPTR